MNKDISPEPDGNLNNLSNGSNELLLKFINSSHFTLYNNIEYLTRYSSNIGIHFYLCQKLLGFSHSEVQFYIPQLVQVLLTVETESMALEELLLMLSGENPHFALLIFWQLQALLTDLATEPSSYGFQVARRVINNLQFVLFNSSRTDKENEKIHENVSPALIFCSTILSTIALPQLNEYSRSLIKSQGKKQKSYVFKLAKNTMRNLTKNITMKNTLANRKHFSQFSNNSDLGMPENMEILDVTTSKDNMSFKKPKQKLPKTLNFDMIDDVGEKLLQERASNITNTFRRKSKTIDHSYVHKIYKHENQSESNWDDEFTSSMPNLHSYSRHDSTTSLGSFDSKKYMKDSDDANLGNKDKVNVSTCSPSKSHRLSHHGANFYNLEPSQLPTTKKIKLLKANYFRCEIQFAIALESISMRLAQVPTDARLSALRAELSLINRDLPAEVDIPILLPQNKKGKLHKLVNIAANEAQVLKSAEKVPFLLFIEYLKDEMDFDPSTEQNDLLLREKPEKGSYIFDLSYINKDNGDSMENDKSNSQFPPSSAFSLSSHTNKKEIDLGDLSMVKLTNQSESQKLRHELMIQSAKKVPIISPNTHSRNPELNFASSLEEITEELQGLGGNNLKHLTDDLPTQMRISAMMLAQLSKSPQQLSDTTNQIRAKIIASMQEVQDRFGYHDLESIHGMAGERKLENDLKTGGLLSDRKSNMSYLGEDWTTKKEKIRKASEYGHYENWQLCSVIAKSGDDLRQEAFACQLIQAMANIWIKENVDVWVKKMKILITSANTGLVETITNAISIHSIKKALTKQMIEDGDLDEKGQIASLKDHFIRAYGNPNEFKFKKAQDNFAASLAAYSVIGYILQIKDRHNGNIMIDNEGHVVHIDFGFMLSNSPGSVGFEAAPFKLTYEYVELLGGLEGEPFKKFVRLTKEAFKTLRKYADQFASMCEIMQKDSSQPCFNAGDQTSIQLRQRFHLELTNDECDDFVEQFLIGKSLGSIYTRLYDHFQLLSQGIYS